MANIRVDALTEVTAIADDDVVMVDGKQGVRATTWASLKKMIKSQCGIDELNTNTTGSGTIVNTFLSTANSTCSWSKKGGIVTVCFKLTASASPSNGTPLITGLPKPIRDIYSAAVSNNSNPVFAYAINTKGELYRNYGGPMDKDQYCYGAISYPTSD